MITRSGSAQIAPPDVDDLPAELTEHPLPAGVAMLRRRRGVPLPALALDTDLAHAGRRGRARPGGCPRVRTGYSSTRRIPAVGEEPGGDPLEPAARQPLVDPLAQEHQERRRAGAAASAPRLGDGAQLVGGHAHAKGAVQRPCGRADADLGCEQGEGAGDRHRPDPVDGDHVREQGTACVVHADADLGERVAPGRSQITSTSSYRSKPSRRCRRAAAPWDTAVTPGVRIAAIARPWKVIGVPARASTPGSGE